MRGAIFNLSSQFICFTNDVDLVGRMFQVVPGQYIKQKCDPEKVGLKVNKTKTK